MCRGEHLRHQVHGALAAYRAAMHAGSLFMGPAHLREAEFALGIHIHHENGRGHSAIERIAEGARFPQFGFESPDPELPRILGLDNFQHIFNIL
jgi:hypothetical protein